jgi:hypothetical protein
MALKTKTGLFSMESFHTKTPTSGMASGFCACACGCGCACATGGYNCAGWCAGHCACSGQSLDPHSCGSGGGSGGGGDDNRI